MTERLLQFIWQFQYFNKTELLALTGEEVQILFPGQYNTNQGPDFSDAKIKIDDTVWAGSVELHLKSSDWNRHAHQHDSNYNNVVLHVVWENDSAPNNLPLIELKGRVSRILLQRYTELMNSSAFIACQRSIHLVPTLTWNSWKERLLAERLIRKSATVSLYLKQNNFHWEETFWWLLARNFGMKVNCDAFEAMARSIPLTMLSKHKNQYHQLEALLFGQAGLLEKNGKRLGEEDQYLLMLRKEYEFLRDKYKIRPIPIAIHFLRMRPSNFPTIRLAQLAMLVNESNHLFSRIKDEPSLQQVRQWMDVTANDYWHYHYRFQEITSFKKKRLGEAMIDNIIVNTVAPVLFAYGNYHNDHNYKEKALKWLEETAIENNSVVHGFENLGMAVNNAFDTQAMIELKTQYCDRRACLDCGVGNYLLRSEN